mmetsp:Transcript_25908/g.41482  ORF Transcript_25908/g.41482 Transcript_25908/m.41482 type:complete len:117 (+) Transcript_25908:568-918(+)
MKDLQEQYRVTAAQKAEGLENSTPARQLLALASLTSQTPDHEVPKLSAAERWPWPVQCTWMDDKEARQTRPVRPQALQPTQAYLGSPAFSFSIACFSRAAALDASPEVVGGEAFSP